MSAEPAPFSTPHDLPAPAGNPPMLDAEKQCYELVKHNFLRDIKTPMTRKGLPKEGWPRANMRRRWPPIPRRVTTQLYDRRDEEVSLDEYENVGI
jgi:hypothetical protein